MALLLAALPFSGGTASPQALLWGASAGVAGIAGTAALYRGLAVGRMGVVAPISGVLAAGIPVVVGLTMGERPGLLALGGIAIGIVAVAIVSQSSGGPLSTAPDRPLREGWLLPGTPEGIAAGVGFGLFFVLLERTPTESGLWPLIGSRASIITIATVAVLAQRSFTFPHGARAQLVGLGAMNILADLLFLLATREGLLSLVAVITSLYPAGTVILARTVLHEPIARSQGVGLALAAASVVLIATGG